MKKRLLLFIKIFFITFCGFCLANIFAVIIPCFSNGFTSFAELIADLPYLLYGAFSLVIAAILVFVFTLKAK